MALKKSLGVVVISAMLMLRVTCAVACEEVGLDLNTLSACHKQLAAELIAEAQAAHKNAESRSEQLSVWIRSQPVGISMSSMHRSGTRLAELGAAAVKINKLNRVKKTAGGAITACTDWRDSTREDCAAGVRCHQAIAVLRKLQR